MNSIQALGYLEDPKGLSVSVHILVLNLSLMKTDVLHQGKVFFKEVVLNFGLVSVFAKD